MKTAPGQAEIEVVAYLRATKNGKPIWSEDCVCEDPVYPSDPDGSDEDSISMPLVRKFDHEAHLSDLRAEVERLRSAIFDHNLECVRMCEQRQKDGDAHCPYSKYGRQCPDCPRDGMVEVALAATEQGGGDV